MHAKADPHSCAGSSVYWVYQRSPLVPLACSNCATTPMGNATTATEPLSLSYATPAPTVIISAQVCY